MFQAPVPKTPALPNHIRDGAFAFIIGLILGIGAAFLRDYVDDSLKGVEDVERQSGAPLIGVVPHVPSARGIGEHAGRNGKRSYLVTLDDPRRPRPRPTGPCEPTCCSCRSPARSASCS